MRNWSKWGFDFWASVLRHVGTAGLSWAGLNVANLSGASVPKVDWEGLGIMLLCGGIIPAVFTFIQSTPVPPDDNDKPTVT